MPGPIGKYSSQEGLYRDTWLLAVSLLTETISSVDSFQKVLSTVSTLWMREIEAQGDNVN